MFQQFAGETERLFGVHDDQESHAVLGFNEWRIGIVCYTTHHVILSSPAPPSPDLEVCLEMKMDLVNVSISMDGTHHSHHNMAQESFYHIF
jgi:hypothetical protein